MAKAKYSYDKKRNVWRTSVWDGTYCSNGTKHRRQLTSQKSSADLERKANALRKKILEQGSSGFSNITFGEYAERWLSVAKASKELNTQKMYRHIVSSKLAPLSGKPLLQITRLDYQSIINENLSHPKTCKNIKLTFDQIIRSAVKEHILPRSALDDILSDISLPKYQKPHKRPLTSMERIAMALADLDDRKRAFVTILYYCGLRRGEALALKPEDFDFREKTVSITKVIVFDNNMPVLKPYPKSDNGIRAVPLPDRAVEILQPYVESVSGFLFHSSGSPMMTETGYKRMWESIVEKMNEALGYDPQQKNPKPEKPIKGLTAHIFRHNYCTELCYHVPDISTKMIARLMGDTEKVVLNVYSHIIENRENVSETINSAF